MSTKSEKAFVWHREKIFKHVKVNAQVKNTHFFVKFPCIIKWQKEEGEKWNFLALPSTFLVGYVACVMKVSNILRFVHHKTFQSYRKESPSKK